jgi:hypothetical protein
METLGARRTIWEKFITCEIFGNKCRKKLWKNWITCKKLWEKWIPFENSCSLFDIYGMFNLAKPNLGLANPSWVCLFLTEHTKTEFAKPLFLFVF